MQLKGTIIMKQLYIPFAIVMVVIHLNLFSSSMDGRKILFITPSPCTPCPSKHCFTLSQFVQLNSGSWISPNTTLIFLAGKHTLDTEFTISNISNFCMISNTGNISGDTHTIHCKHQVNFRFENMTTLLMKGLKFIGCGNNRFSFIDSFIIENTTFQGQNDSKTAIYVTETNLTIVNSSFTFNRVGHCLSIFDPFISSNRSVRVGGAIFIAKSNISIIKCIFINNSAEIGGAIYSTGYALNNISISNSIFISNRAAMNHDIRDCNQLTGSSGRPMSLGGAIAIFNSTMVINGSAFINNTSEVGEAGALSIQQLSVTIIHNSEFYGNRANSYGGSLYVREGDISIDSSNFFQNSANQGGVMHLVQDSQLRLTRSMYKDNAAKRSGGAISLDQESHLLYDNHSLFIHNRAMIGGALYAVRSELAFIDSVFSHNRATESGGALYILQSPKDVNFDGHCNLTYNSADTGGAIYAIESSLSLNGIISAFFYQLTIAFNEASDSGGGVYLYHSTFISTTIGSIANISSNNAKNKGGGIHATNSLITCMEPYRKTEKLPYQNLMIFTNNSARQGGALYLESGAQLRVIKVLTHLNPFKVKLNTSIYFASNIAQYGTAIYVNDESYSDVCDSSYSVIKSTATSKADCFVQVFSGIPISGERSNVPNIVFTKDGNRKFTASDSTVIFGGLLDRCIPDPHRAEVLKSGYAQKDIDGFTYLKLISNIADVKKISSLPVRVCFCTPDGKANCSYEPPTIHVMKGKIFNVSLSAVDQANHTITNVTIYSSLNHRESILGEGQSAQVTGDICTNLSFSIYSPHASDELILYPEGPCRNAKRSQSRIYINFKSCRCPIGFQTNHERNDCICICNSQLKPYFTEEDAVNSELLTRHGNFWASFINDSNSHYNSSGFLIYPYCPLDYCLPPTFSVPISFSHDNGADAQCANNRSGLLCALCQPGLSLSFGSSWCIPCSKSWYKGYIPAILITVIVGILLVALLMIFNLTVAIGTLNGIIFYSNIIGANHSTFFSGLSPSIKYFSVLISWLNLEVGFDICFFEGMDTYWKTWLQLAFPAYVIFLVILTIIVSDCSMRFSRLIARRNPVATLTTLILLSYTKFLQTMITSLSFATLDYPDGSHRRVWLPDATIEYLSRKHIPLFLVAVTILTIGIIYTCIIFFWQWLLLYQDKTCIFKWVNSQRLYHFVEPYQAPYVSKHRYWTGLLLFTRIALYLVFALNVSGDPGVNLLAIIISAVTLLVIKGLLDDRLYKSTYIDISEIVCYMNLCVLCAIRLKYGDNEIVEITTHLSGIITYVQLIIVISYHIYTTFCSECLKKCQCLITERQLDDRELTSNATTTSLSTESRCIGPISSVLQLHLPGTGKQHSAASERHCEGNDNNISSISADSTYPLLDNYD